MSADNFCAFHGYQFMYSKLGEVISHCRACEDHAEYSTELARYRNALLWAYDYFGSDCQTAKLRQDGIFEIGRFLRGDPTRIAKYKPNDWDASWQFTDAGAIAAARRALEPKP